MSKNSFLLFILSLLLASISCNLPGAAAPTQAVPTIQVPTFTPTAQVEIKPTDPFTPTAQVEIKPTDPPAPPTFTPEPTIPPPQPRLLDPRALAGCDIFLDTDFPDRVGTTPTAAISLSDHEKKACEYTFESGTISVSIFTSLPGLEAFGTVRQFDAIEGGTIEYITFGEQALFKYFDTGYVKLEAVLNGWYVVLETQGFDEKHLLALGEFLLSHLTPYSP